MNEQKTIKQIIETIQNEEFGTVIMTYNKQANFALIEYTKKDSETIYKRKTYDIIHK